jgi:hypothetical protein
LRRTYKPYGKYKNGVFDIVGYAWSIDDYSKNIVAYAPSEDGYVSGVVGYALNKDGYIRSVVGYSRSIPAFVFDIVSGFFRNEYHRENKTNFPMTVILAPAV